VVRSAAGIVLGLIGLLAVGSAPAHAADQRALLTLRVNAEARGEVPALLRNEELYLRVQDLEEARLHLPSGNRIHAADDTYIRLSSLAPEITYSFDEEALRIDVTASPMLFGTTVANLAAKKPEGFRVSTDTSAFLNYALQSFDFAAPDVFLDGGLSLGGRYLFTTTAAKTSQEGITRGLTALDYEDPARLLRLTLGDTVAQTTQLGSGAVVGGITYRRDWGMDPYVIYRPDHVLLGTASTPSLAKIYLNGVLVREYKLPAGPFEFHNLTIPGGSREVEIVFQDAFGRETRSTSLAYIVPVLLAPGSQDYSYTAGWTREPSRREHPWAQYRQPALFATHRYGATDHLTIGGRLELVPQRLSLGPSITLGSDWGQLDVEAGASYDEGSAGYAAAASYTYSGSRVGFGASARIVGDRYATAVTPAAEDRTVLSLRGSLTYQILPGWSAGLTAAHGRSRDAGTSSRLNLVTGFTLTRNLTALLRAGAGTATGEPTAYEAGLAFHYTFGGGVNVRVETRFHRDEPAVHTLSVSQSPPAGEGFGFRVSGTSAEAGSVADGTFTYNSRFGRADTTITGDDSGVHQAVSWAGGIGMVNGILLAGRPVDRGFGMVQVADLANVRVLVNNTPIGATNDAGRLVIPGLLPYFGNRVSIATEDIPVDRSIERHTLLAVPPLRGGTYLNFQAPRVRGFQGRLQPASPNLPEHFGPGALSLTVQDQSFESAVGRQGEFYLENVPAGEHEATVELSNVRCRLRLAIPDTEEPFVSLGVLPCVPVR
jgi:outer membrane usher protein